MVPKMITIHCSATPNGRAVTGDDIRRWHINERGFKEIGYHGVIEIPGDFFKGRPDSEVGAHVQGHNIGNLGVCMVGTDRFTPNQFLALKWILKAWMAQYAIKPSKIFGHYQFNEHKSCPGMDIDVIRRWVILDDDDLIKRYLIGAPALV